MRSKTLSCRRFGWCLLTHRLACSNQSEYSRIWIVILNNAPRLQSFFTIAYRKTNSFLERSDGSTRGIGDRPMTSGMMLAENLGPFLRFPKGTLLQNDTKSEGT
jgi:hypothetical protein